ncbi:MAG: hypothetical protein DI527_08855 [Chelatococcus sp.]|nr:MAG: hypothetical protein DI527_08855 [Chelatococcus sp.]
MILGAGCASAGMLICTPAFAAGGEMPSLFAFIVIGAFVVLGAALCAVPVKFMALFMIAVWLGGFVLAINNYGSAGLADRSAKFAMVMLSMTLPIVAGWLLGHAARKRLSGIGTRHG